MQKIINLINPDIQQLNQVIIQDLSSTVVLINQVSHYIINAGGKRLRPLLTILCGRMCGYQDAGHDLLLHRMAAMIEYIHTATLLHDDVVDESNLRRGHGTANAVFGNAASVLVGDFIYTRAFQLMVTSNSLPLLKIMADATNIISEGEVLQLLNIGCTELTQAEYLQVIQSKTAKLFEVAARVAGIVCGVTAATEQSLAQYACALGTAFQIADDILDYTGSATTMGKNVGDDLIEGKVTLPLIYLLQQGNSQQQQLIREAIANPKQLDLPHLLEVINKSDAFTYCRSVALNYAEQAKLQLANFAADNVYRQALIELADYAVSRLH